MENYDEFFRRAKLMSSIHGMKTVKKCEKDVEMKPVSPVKRIFEEIGQRQDEYKYEEDSLKCLNGNVGF